jgi:CubicO group peptidase (beta-lactamase class C family)
MKIKRFLIGSLIACSLLTAAHKVFSKTAPRKPPSSNPTYEDLDAYLQQQIKRLRIPGISLAVVEGDQITHLRGFGEARPGGETPTPETPFLIGSLTKSFTALGVMQLVEAGEVDLDAPVQRYLPWFRVADPQASAQITVRHLLNQTSGIPTNPGWIPLADFDSSPDAMERQAREFAEVELIHPVGSAFEYSNANYNLLGLIIEAASGESYQDYIQNHIFSPLEMDHSYTAKSAARQDNLAVGHRFWFWFPSPAPELPIPEGSLPSGQLISSAEDMAHYLIAHLNGGRYEEAQILSQAGISKLHRGAAESVEMGISMGEYAMGWYESDLNHTKLIWHTGLVPDFSSYMALLPEQKKGLVLLANSGHFMMQPLMSALGEGAAKQLAGQEPAPLQLGFLPWLMRGLLLIPLLQAVGVAATLRRLRSWHRDPSSRPAGLNKWGRHVLLPLVPHVLVTLTLIPLLGAMRGFWRLFTPDYSWVALISGSFAGVWTFLRTGLVVKALKTSSTPSPRENHPQNTEQEKEHE